MKAVKAKNYLTDLRDRFAGNPKRAILNVSVIVSATLFVIWVGSLFDLLPPPTINSIIGASLGPAIVIICALLIRWRWPKQSESE